MYKSSGYGETMGERPQVSSPEPMEVTSIDLYAKGVVLVEDPVLDIELWLSDAG